MLSRIYNCRKPGNRPIDIAATSHFTLGLHISKYKCTNCDSLHVKICPALHYIISHLWVEFCLLPDVLQRFLTNLASTGGPHKIGRRAACGPPAAGWTALM